MKNITKTLSGEGDGLFSQNIVLFLSNLMKNKLFWRPFCFLEKTMKGTMLKNMSEITITSKESYPNWFLNEFVLFPLHCCLMCSILQYYVPWIIKGGGYTSGPMWTKPFTIWIKTKLKSKAE